MEIDDPLLAKVLEAAGPEIKDKVIHEFKNMTGIVKDKMEELTRNSPKGRLY